MYKAFFNLKKKPFELVPDPDFIYPSAGHKKALHYLRYGMTEKAGFMLLTGGIGTGKTTLTADLLRDLNANTTPVRIVNTRVDSEQLLEMVNDQLGLETAGRSKALLIRDLGDFLIRRHAGGGHVVLIIDEAQNLRPDLLEEVRMLSNLETDTAKLIQILLVGQPELRYRLSEPGLRQLRQRISVNCHLNPLTRHETSAYISHRLEVAGNRDALRMSEDGLDAIHGCCRGIPRIVNILGDFLLLAAYIEERRAIDAAMVRDIAGELDFENLYWGIREPGAKTGVDRSALFSALSEAP